MPSSLLPSLTRLTLKSSPIVPTAAPADSKSSDSFYADTVHSLKSGSGAEKITALANLQEHVREAYTRARVQRFVDAYGIDAMVELLRESELSIKTLAARVLHMLFVVGVAGVARVRFVKLGGVPVLVRMLRELASHIPKQALVPFLDLIQVLVGFDGGRELLRTQNAVEALASVVREAGLQDTPKHDHEGAQALRLMVTLVFDSSYMVEDSYKIDLSILIVDGAWLARPALPEDPTRQRAMKALEKLTESNGAHTDALRQALVAEGALPVLLHAMNADARAVVNLQQGPPEPFPPLERLAWTALRQLTEDYPKWRVLVDELSLLMSQRDSLVRASGDWTEMRSTPLLSLEAVHLAAKHPRWFILLGWMDIVVLVLTTPSTMLWMTAEDTTAMVVALKQCFNVVDIWRKVQVAGNIASPLPHPFGENAVYSALVPVLLSMLHDDQDASGERRRAAARCLVKLSNADWNSSQSMHTETVIVSLLAFLKPTLTAAALSDEKSEQLVLSVLFNVVHATNEAMDRFYVLGGPAVIGKYLTSASPSILKATVLLVRIIAESEAELYEYEHDELEEDRVERDRVDDVQSLVALLRPGRVDDTDTRLEVLTSLEALVAPDLPAQTETHSLSEAQLATLASACDAMMGAGGIEVLIPLMHVNTKEENDESHLMSIRLLRKMMIMHLPHPGGRAVKAAVRFAVAGGIAALVDAGQRQDGNTDPEHVNRMQIHLSETFKLETFLRKKSTLPKWIPMLLDVTNAIVLKQPSEQDQEAKDCHKALPEERWGHPKWLRVSVCSYGQIYDLLSQYRAMRASAIVPDLSEEVVDNCPVFAWMDDQRVLLRAALSRIPAIKGGKEVFIENHKPSLLAAELWIVHALSDVLLTNVPVLPVEDGARLTVAQNEQVVKYRELLDGAQLLQAQYAWAVAHPNPLPHFVEAIRTEVRLNGLLLMLVQKIEAPMHSNGSHTMTLRYELERYDEDEFVPGAEKRKRYNGEEEERRARKPRTTSAALRASIATLYGAEQTDATMTRLFQHLQFP